MSGSNPFILLGDRSKRAVGAGLFQLPPRDPAKPSDAPRGKLRLLGVWSKSLNDQQSRWTVWEGELFALRETLHPIQVCRPGCSHRDRHRSFKQYPSVDHGGIATTSENPPLVDGNKRNGTHSLGVYPGCRQCVR